MARIVTCEKTQSQGKSKGFLIPIPVNEKYANQVPFPRFNRDRRFI